MLGLARRKCEVLVKEFKAVGNSQEQANGNGWHQVRNLYFPQSLPCSGSINLSCFKIIAWNRLKAGNIDDHHVADLLPERQDDHAPKSCGAIQRQKLLSNI